MRAAVVGVGYLGRYHAQKYAALPDVDLVAVADIRPERARRVGREVGAAPYPHHREIVGKVDVASVAVPTTDHFEVARELLEHGIHVLVEKPICATLEEAESLVDTAQRHGAVLQVGHLERFNPAVQAMRGKLNSPLFWECHRIGPYPGRGGDVDVVMDLMIHDIDLLLDFMNDELTAVDAVGVPVLTAKYDIVNARLRFATGCVANLTASRVSAKSMRKLRVFQPDAYLSVDCGKGEVVEFKRLPPGEREELPRIVTERLEVEERDVLLDEITAFVESARYLRPPLVDGAAGMRCLEIALRVIRGVEESFPEGFWERFAGDRSDVRQ
jgi:predicted dehydrogenase